MRGTNRLFVARVDNNGSTETTNCHLVPCHTFLMIPSFHNFEISSSHHFWKLALALLRNPQNRSMFSNDNLSFCIFMMRNHRLMTYSLKFFLDLVFSSMVLFSCSPHSVHGTNRSVVECQERTGSICSTIDHLIPCHTFSWCVIPFFLPHNVEIPSFHYFEISPFHNFEIHKVSHGLACPHIGLFLS